MRKYSISKSTDPYKDLDKVKPLKIDRLQRLGRKGHEITDRECDISAFGSLVYDDEALYVKLRAVEKNIRAEEKMPLGEACSDSCLEFFICPMAEKGDKRYFNIEWSASGCLFLGFGQDIPSLVRILPEDETAEDIFGQKIEMTEDGWQVTYRIPFSFIRRFFPQFKARSGMSIRANCYKCGDKTELPHYLSWCFISAKKFTFHYPNDFGIMIFE